MQCLFTTLFLCFAGEVQPKNAPIPEKIPFEVEIPTQPTRKATNTALLNKLFRAD